VVYIRKQTCGTNFPKETDEEINKHANFQISGSNTYFTTW
jgi:hypothetical protein